MAHNTKQIIELIGKRPGIRLVEIADEVDCGVNEVEWALSDALKDGSVIKSLVQAPNGVMQPSFSLSSDQPKQEPETKPSVQKTKVQLALDYLATVDVADDVAMRKAMGLPIGGNVRAYISTQLQKRQIIQVVGGYKLEAGYKLGDSKPEPTLPPAAKVPEPTVRAITPEVLANVNSKLESAGLTHIAPTVPSISESLKESMANHKPVIVPTVFPQVPVQPFRCAVWSDNGAMTLMRGGLEVMTLTAEELKILRTYMEHTCTVRDGVKV